MKILDGIEVADYIKERHIRQVSGLTKTPKLVILYDQSTHAGAAYLKAKYAYGQDIGVAVEIREISTEELEDEIKRQVSDHSVTGIIVQLPLADTNATEQILSAIPASKDIDGLCSQVPYQSATPKGIIWLLAAYNIELKGKIIAVVGQGTLVGLPLADTLESSGLNVLRYDIHTKDLEAELVKADIIISATGKRGLITSAMIKPEAIVVDAGSPHSELAEDVLERQDISRTPNPGGVGPMTVAALFDNLLIAAGL